jgi:hypothetical protein
VSDEAPAMLQVVRGDPTDEELAALLAVLGARSGADTGGPRPRSGWNDPARLVRRTLRPGPGGWRASGQPLT